MPFTRRSVRSAAFLASAAVALSIGTAANAEEPKPIITTAEEVGLPAEELIKRQDSIHMTTDPIMQRVEREGLQTKLAGIVASPDLRSATVYWKGTIPQWVTDATDGSSVGIESAAHSETELYEAATRLQRSPAADDHALTAVEGRADGSGLNVTVVAPDASKSTSDRRAQLQHAALVPVLSIKEVTLGDHASVKNFSRGNDSPPWYAGGMRGSNCTLGFAVKTATDEVRLMTANHCGGAVGGNVRDGSGDLIGTLTVRNSEWDAQLIRPTNYSVLTGYGRVFHGNWYTTSSRAVIGSTYPIVNDYLCVSGAFSGTHCSLRVTSTNFSGPSGQAGDGPRLVVTAAPGEYAGCSGDSGGPIIDPSGTASSHAAGMVIGPADPSINELVTSNVRGGGAVCNRQITFFRHTAVAGHFNVNTITH